MALTNSRIGSVQNASVQPNNEVDLGHWRRTQNKVMIRIATSRDHIIQSCV